MSTGRSNQEDTSQELSLLQTLRLKGRAAPDALASAAGIDDSTVERLVASAVEADYCTRTGQFVKLSA
jgi:DNA-binding IclR family transcriptional regulator